eukprot:g6235.t1
MPNAATTLKVERTQATYDVARKVFQSPFKAVPLPENAALPALVLGRPHFAPGSPGAGRPALIDGQAGAMCRFGELRGLVDRCAAALAARGFGTGDTLALAMPDVREHATAASAALRLGGAVPPLNPLLSPEEFAHYLSLAGARWVVTVPDGSLRGLQPLSNLLGSGGAAALRGTSASLAVVAADKDLLATPVAALSGVP